MLPDLERLHERHYGVTVAIGATLAEAATVCLGKYHSPPSTFSVKCNGVASSRLLRWSLPNKRAQAAHLNEIDVIELGACAVSIAAVETELSLYVISRTRTKSGADYWLQADPSKRTLDGALRLEVSGMGAGTLAALAYRLKSKMNQTQAAAAGAAVAAVVAFEALNLAMTTI